MPKLMESNRSVFLELFGWAVSENLMKVGRFPIRDSMITGRNFPFRHWPDKKILERFGTVSSPKPPKSYRTFFSAKEGLERLLSVGLRKPTYEEAIVFGRNLVSNPMSHKSSTYIFLHDPSHNSELNCHYIAFDRNEIGGEWRAVLLTDWVVPHSSSFCFGDILVGVEND